MILRLAFTLLFTLSLCTCVRAQGPIGGFPVKKGEAAFALSYSRETYDTYLGRDGAEQVRDIETISYSLFAEVGLNDVISLIATLPYMETNERDGNLQDGSVWLKYMNLNRRGEKFYHRVFTAVGLSTPIGAYRINGPEALGLGASVFQLKLAYQFQHDDGWFLHAQSGIDLQFDPDSRTAWPLLLRAGYSTSFLYVEGWAEFVTALESGLATQAATAGTGSSWQRLGGTVYAPLQPWLGVQIGGAWVLGGEYIGKSGRLNAGVVIKLGGKQRG